MFYNALAFERFPVRPAFTDAIIWDGRYLQCCPFLLYAIELNILGRIMLNMTIREFNFKLCRVEIDLFYRSRFTGLYNGACCP